MGKQKKEKPVWNKKQIADLKKYLESEEFAEEIKIMYEEEKERERKEKQEFAEWWKNNKDIPYMLSI